MCIVETSNANILRGERKKEGEESFRSRVVMKVIFFGKFFDNGISSSLFRVQSKGRKDEFLSLRFESSCSSQV